MLGWAVTFLIVALIASLLGFGGIAAASVETGIPMAFGVLTTNTVQQAVDRAGTSGNKGFDAAMTAIEMANLLRRLRVPD